MTREDLITLTAAIMEEYPKAPSKDDLSKALEPYGVDISKVHMHISSAYKMYDVVREAVESDISNVTFGANANNIFDAEGMINYVNFPEDIPGVPDDYSQKSIFRAYVEGKDYEVLIRKRFASMLDIMWGYISGVSSIE